MTRILFTLLLLYFHLTVISQQQSPVFNVTSPTQAEILKNDSLPTSPNTTEVHKKLDLPTQSKSSPEVFYIINDKPASREEYIKYQKKNQKQ